MSQSTKRLPRSTRARLLALADLLEAHPKQWNQSTWASPADGDRLDPVNAAGSGHVYGTQACVAGWATHLTPAAEAVKLGWDHYTLWWDAGRTALGIEPDLANKLFGTYTRKPTLLRALRVIAEIPHGKRTLEAARAAGAFKRVAS